MTCGPAAIAAVAALALGASAGSSVTASAPPRSGVIHAQLTAFSLVPPAAGGSAPPASATEPAGVSATTQLHQSILPDVFAILPQGITAAQLARLGKLRHVRSVIAVDGGAVHIKGHLVNVIGVDPGPFRSWTPPQTADLQGIWTSLSGGGFVTTAAAGKSLGLRAGQSYQVSGAQQPTVAFGGTATLGLPDVDALVGTGLSRELGLVHQIGVLINAPGASASSLDGLVRGVLGRQTRIVGLTQTQNAQQERLPVDNGPVSAGRPDNYLSLFRDSAKLYCPGLPWSVLAAIGQIESGDGQNDGPSSAGALGPMQFMPSTWARWGMDAFGETGPPDILNPFDAVPAAAEYLCAAGGDSQATLSTAIFAYNHAQWYVNEVLALAQEYGQEYG
jgi:hypothetical protein